MQGQLNTLNLRNNRRPEDNTSPQEVENERFYQEERIRRAQEDAQTRATQEEIIAEKKKTKGGVEKVVFLQMIFVAITIDIIQLIIGLLDYFLPPLGWAINGLVNIPILLGFYMWFKSKGIKFDSTRKMASLPFSLLLEYIPYLNILPAWTLCVLINTQKDKLASKVGM